MKSIALSQITKYLDSEFDDTGFGDASNNGLQVESAGKITKICCGVDASLEFFQEAKKRNSDLVICHHGISWGDSLKRITDINFGRVSFLIKNDMALYACHLPLDAHPKYGNNAIIAKALGLKSLKKFGMYNGKEIGFQGVLPKPVSYARFKKMVEKITGNEIRTMDFGRKTIKSVAVVSGGAAEEVYESGAKNIDVYLSGEAKLSAYHIAAEYKTNAVFAGHYATEVFGIREVAKLLKRKFKIDAEFIDLGISF